MTEKKRLFWLRTDRGVWEGRMKRGLRKRPCMVEILPYDEPPDHLGCWMLRFTDAVPDAIDTYPGDVDLADLDKAKAYAEGKLFSSSADKAQDSRRNAPA